MKAKEEIEVRLSRLKEDYKVMTSSTHKRFYTDEFRSTCLIEINVLSWCLG